MYLTFHFHTEAGRKLPHTSVHADIATEFMLSAWYPSASALPHPIDEGLMRKEASSTRRFPLFTTQAKPSKAEAPRFRKDLPDVERIWP